MPTRVLLNPTTPGPVVRPSGDPLAFHRRLPGYAPTPLLDAPGIAAALGVGEVWVKDESARLGLPSYKILGASWAVYRTVRETLGVDPGDWETVGELAQALAPLTPLTLVAATDGNHGRAVARMARLLGLDGHVLVPAGTVRARSDAIEGEGARVDVVEGTYDEAVARSAELADDRHLVISDTAWDGYADVPRWVIEGYSTVFREVDDALAERGAGHPDVVAVQIGVGALAAATVTHYAGRARIVGVEPDTAACVLAAVGAGRVVEVPGPHRSIMAGLNCGLASPVALPVVQAGIDVFVTVGDDDARAAMRALAQEGVVSGESGAAGAAGLAAALGGPHGPSLRDALGLDAATRVLLLSTEGATDPAAYEAVVGAATGC